LAERIGRRTGEGRNRRVEVGGSSRFTGLEVGGKGQEAESRRQNAARKVKAE
jgi:hypothetical protein